MEACPLERLVNSMAYTYGSITNCKLGNGTAPSNTYQCRLGYQVNSQSIENNTSNITLRLEVRSVDSSYYTNGYSQTTTIDGTSLSSKTFDMSNTNVWQVFGERTITVTHNSDGVYSTTKNGSFTTTATGNWSLKSGNASVLVNPSTISRASQPTVSSGSVNMGSSVTITTNRKNANFTHTLTYNFGNTNGTIASNVGTSMTWTPSLNLANQIPNTTSGTCTIICKTYNGSTLIGTKTVTLTLSIPSSVIPSISSINISEGGSAVPSSWGVYVQNKSQLKVVTSASGIYGSTITSYKITGIDSNTYNSSNFISSVLTQSGSKTINVVVTDSRGRTASKTATYTCVAYSNPKITSYSAVRCNSDGTTNEEGTYLKYTFKAEISPVSNKNSKTFKIGYKLSSEGSYTYKTISSSSYSLSQTGVVLSNVIFSADNSYDIQFHVGDYFTSSTNTVKFPTGFTLINYNASGKAMAIGKVSEAEDNEKLFEMAIPTKFTDKVYMKNKPMMSYVKDISGREPFIYSLCTAGNTKIIFDTSTTIHTMAFILAEKNQQDVCCSLAYYGGVKNIIGSMASCNSHKITLDLGVWSYVIIISTAELNFTYE